MQCQLGDYHQGPEGRLGAIDGWEELQGLRLCMVHGKDICLS